MFGDVPILSVLASGLIAGGVLWVLGQAFRPKPALAGGSFSSRLLVKDGDIIDGRGVEHAGFGGADMGDLKAQLEQRFDLSLGELSKITKRRCITSGFSSDEAVLTIDPVPEGHRLTIWDLSGETARQTHSSLSLDGIFRQALACAPEAVFAFDPDGKIRWQNDAFCKFSEGEKAALLRHAQCPNPEKRLDLSMDEGCATRARHFELKRSRVGQYHVAFATDVSRLVEADNVRNAFVQTLTKTFADLTTGLAVFDRDRRLVLFNPAILDLTGLPAEFLIARPGLFEFFDQLRDRRVLPEPKDYRGWREQIARMIESASDGHYVESWSLPNGVTYRLSGRPHPDGAVAFLIEDISDETALARRYNTQVELRQSVLDHLDDAIAVIGADGLLVFCNDKLNDVLGFDPDSRLSSLSLEDLLETCRVRFPDAPIWDEVLKANCGSVFNKTASLNMHETVTCHYAGLPNGFSILKLSFSDHKADLDA